MQTCGTWTSSYRLVLGLLQELDIKPEFAPAEILDDRASTEQDARWDVVFTRIAALQEYGWHAAIQEMLWATDTLNGALTEMDWDRLEPELGRVRARWTDEKRSENVVNYLTPVATPIPVQVPRIRSKSTAPEVTLTYKPTDDMTFFGAYKRGFKSGSFIAATVATPNSNNSFGDEKVKGWEVGFKSRLLDRRMLVNIAFYDYKFKGLQVGAIEQPQGGIPIIHTINATSSSPTPEAASRVRVVL